MLKQIYSTTLNIPPPIHAICMVQFWSWIGWFPFLFYGSTWVGEIYLRHEAPGGKADALTDVGRAGSIAFIVFAMISFGASIVLPWIIESPDDDEKPGYTPRPPQNLHGVTGNAKKPSLLTAWMLGCATFAVAMVFAPFVRSVRFATFIVALCGVPWAIAGWAPGTFLGVEVNKMGSSIPTSHSRRRPSDASSIEMKSNGSSSHPSSPSSPSSSSSSSSAPSALHIRQPSDLDTSGGANTSTGELSGIYFGILNIYTTLPQFVGTGISWVVFSILEPGKSPELSAGSGVADQGSKEGVSGIGVCLFIGALCSVMAAWATRRLKPVR